MHMILHRVNKLILKKTGGLNEKVTSTSLIMKPTPEMDLAVTFSRVMA